MSEVRCLPEPKEILRLADEIIGDGLRMLNEEAEDTLTATHAAQWLMIGMAMAIVENGTTQQDYLSMLKGWEMAMS